MDGRSKSVRIKCSPPDYWCRTPDLTRRSSFDQYRCVGVPLNDIKRRAEQSREVTSDQKRSTSTACSTYDSTAPKADHQAWARPPLASLIYIQGICRNMRTNPVDLSNPLQKLTPTLADNQCYERGVLVWAVLCSVPESLTRVTPCSVAFLGLGATLSWRCEPASAIVSHAARKISCKSVVSSVRYRFTVVH